MSDTAAPTSPKKKVAAKKPKAVPSHPPVAQMVNGAITGLKYRKGSSLAAIKKYMAATYKVDTVKLGPFIRRYLKKAVTDGKLQQTKGTGASGSFRVVKTVEPKKPKKVAEKKQGAKKEKVAKKPKATQPKKPKAKTATKSPKKATKANTPKKAKKSPKKAAKPKKPKAAKKLAAKKPAAKKAKK